MDGRKKRRGGEQKAPAVENNVIDYVYTVRGRVLVCRRAVDMRTIYLV